MCSIIKKLEDKIKNKNHNKIETVHIYAILSYLHLVKYSKKKINFSIIVAKASRKIFIILVV